MSVPPDSTLANLEQIIADLRRELAQLTAERDEAHRRRDHLQAREAATAEVFEAINFSPGNPAPVFETILEKAHALCGATYGSLQLYDGKRFYALAVHGMSEPLARRLREGFVPGPNHPGQQLLAGEDYIHVRDCAEVDDPMARATVEQGGIRTMLHVALRRDNKLIGKVTAGRKEVRPFADEEISLLRTFAAQAVIAMENARLLTETREALEQQTATAEVLQVINSSPGDLAPVFEAMLHRALALCGAAFGVLRTYDGEIVHTAAQRGVPLSLVDFMRKPNRLAAGSASATGALLRGENFVHIADIRDSESYRTGHPFRRALADLGGARTTLWVPLRKDEAFLGAIILYRQETRPFTDKQIALLQNFAEQAVIAMENARLLTETREALEQQTATAEVLLVINSSPGDLAPVFDAMLEKAMRLCGADFGVMNRYDGKHFHHAADQGVPSEYARYRRERGPTTYGPGTTPARLVAGENLIHTADLIATEAYERADPARRALVDLGGARTHLTAALRKGDVLLGDISIYCQDVRPFSTKQISLLQNFAAQAVIAIENARLLTETRDALEEQTAMAEVLQVINSSPGNLTPVFETILEKAHALCGADYGSLQLYDGEKFCAVAVHGMSEPLARRLREGFVPGPKHPARRLLAGEDYNHVHDC